MGGDTDTSGTALPASGAKLAARVREGDRRALARAISLIENGTDVGQQIVADLYPDTGDAHLTGFTGPPGVGKSSLMAALIGHLRSEHDDQIGVISVDPSSPFSSGAVLGDRIRLTDHFLDPAVYIRSMGTRGHLGGLAQSTLQVALALDAAGKNEVFIETVGVGQSEIEIASLADTVVLVLMPGSGDAVQALKAGIMEIPDVIVINKADHPQVRMLKQQVRTVLALDTEREWMPPIIETVATDNTGVDNLWAAVGEHRAFLAEDGRLAARRRRNLESEVFALASARAQQQLEGRVAADPRLQELVTAMHERKIDPLTCVNRLFNEVFDTDDSAPGGAQ